MGMFFIYAGVSLGREKVAIDAIAEELEKLGREGLTPGELAVCRQRLKSGYIFGQETMGSRMNALGKNRLLLGRNYSDEEVMAELDAVTVGASHGGVAAECSVRTIPCVATLCTRLVVSQRLWAGWIMKAGRRRSTSRS